MNKVIFGLTTFLISTLLAHATISVNWVSTSGNIKLSDATTPLPVGSFAQLIHAGNNNTISTFNAADPFTVSGDDTVIETHVTTFAGFILPTPQPTTVDATTFGGSEDEFVGGRVYVRIFNSALSGSVTEYGETSLSSATGDQDPTAGPAAFPTTIDASGTTLMSLAAVPEPSSLALVILGSIVGLWRHRKLHE